MYFCVCIYVYNHPKAFAHSETFKNKVQLKLTSVIKINIFLPILILPTYSKIFFHLIKSTLTNFKFKEREI